MKTSCSILFVLFTIVMSAQGHKNDYPEILITDSNWSHEYFPFPIGFAQEIEYEGLEDAVFPKGWSNQESDEFWSYAFAWNIKSQKALSKQQLENDLGLYFDGLMKLDHENKDHPEVKKSTITLQEKDNNIGEPSYKGTVHTLNAFHTQKAMTLNVTIDQHLCINNDNAVIIFRFSPRDFNDDIWNRLNALHKNNQLCND